MQITTDRKWKPFLYRYEVPAKILADRFDHLSEDDAPDGFFRYRGAWYHTSDFMRVDNGPESAFAGWHGVATDTYFSATLIEISADGESYRVARAYS
jgi:hypothetical protein